MIVELFGSKLDCNLTEEEVKVAIWLRGQGSTRLSTMFTKCLIDMKASMDAESSRVLFKEFLEMSQEDRTSVEADIRRRRMP